MINCDNITAIIEGYKEYFPLHWKNEKYKWEAVKHFQDNWDIDAEDFGAMFKKATEKAGKLLSSAHSYPRGMILEFAKSDNEAVRQMFIKLYDESVDLSERIETFVNTSEELRIKYNDGTWNNHYQNTNAISVYLWLRYPDKYYIYKYEIYRDVANELGSDYKPKKRFSVNNIIDGYAMYDEICSALQDDKDIREMIYNALTENCYYDTKLKTLTIDFGFYLCRFYLDEKEEETEQLSPNDEIELDNDGWYPLPKEYSPNLSVDDWKKLLLDKDVFNEKSIDIFRKVYELGGICTCKELSEKYGNSANYYNSNAFITAKKVHKKSNCPLYLKSDGQKRWWCIPFYGKRVKGNHPGVYFWKLREELAQAIKEVWINQNEKYTKENFLTDVFMSQREYDKLAALLKRKKNIILQGAPGVGKTFCAKRLAWSVLGEKNNDLIKIVQFHQSYSYEDFIMGYRPNDEGGFDLTEGAFIPFCKKARNDSANDYFFIIDEINRGNLSKIFGELLMLIENDKRGKENTINLVYGNKSFYIPDNLYLIGMMNTADRSLAMIDYALRRRFAFFEMKPAFESDGFRKYQESLSNKKFNNLINCIISLNQTITDDETLGEGFCIGHSYFCNLEEIDDKALSDTVEYEIIPMLKEYWFDEPAKVRDWSERLRSAVK